MSTKSAAIDGPILGKSVSFLSFSRLTLVGFTVLLSVADYKEFAAHLM